MPVRAQRGPLVQELTRANPWWTQPQWQAADPPLLAARRAPFDWAPRVLAGIAPPNLYTLRGPRRVGKSTALKQAIVRLCAESVDPRRICYFAADALSTFTDLINLFQAARMLFQDLSDLPRYFLLDEVTAIPESSGSGAWSRRATTRTPSLTARGALVIVCPSNVASAGLPSDSPAKVRQERQRACPTNASSCSASTRCRSIGS